MTKNNVDPKTQLRDVSRGDVHTGETTRVLKAKARDASKLGYPMPHLAAKKVKAGSRTNVNKKEEISIPKAEHQFNRSFEEICAGASNDCRLFRTTNVAELCLACNMCEDVCGRIGRTAEASNCLSISRTAGCPGSGN